MRRTRTTTHAIKQVKQERDGISGGVARVQCTCGQTRQTSSFYGTGFSHEIGQQMRGISVPLPNGLDRAVLDAARKHGDGHWTAPPLDEARSDLTAVVSSLEDSAALLRARAALLPEAARQMETGAGELRPILGADALRKEPAA